MSRKLYDNTETLQEVLELLNNKAAGGGGTDTSDATATSADILIDKTAYANGEKITGSIPLQSAKTITPSASEQVAISSGYYASGDVKVQGDANLTAENIKKGATIFGVEGNFEGEGGGEQSTEGLSYTFDDAQYPTCAICSGVGTSTETDIIIASKYEGYPVTKIAKNAFDNNKNIVSVTLPWTLQTIMQYAFRKCTSLKNIRIPNNVTKLEESVFRGCTALESLEIPHSVKSLPSMMVRGCTKLKNLILNEGVTTFGSSGDSVFYECPSLTQLYLPSTIADFRRGGISLDYITDVYFAGTIDQWAKCSKNFTLNAGHWFEFTHPLEEGANFHINADLKNVVLTDATYIATAGLAFITTMESIHLPKALSSINTLVFYNCVNLTNITIDEENSAFRVEGNCVIRKSNNQLLVGCAGSVIPDGVASISEYAFAGSGLKTVIIPNSVTSIGNWAFAYSSLENATIQSTATTLGGTFYECNKLKSVSISSTVKSISSYTFYYCVNLKRLDFSTHTAVPTLSSSALSSVNSDLQIKVPANLIDSWKAATNWANYADKIVTEFTNTL